jgi:molecular chaperone DnaK
LNVTAKDKASGKAQSITISGSSTLSREEVERMVREAEMNAAADRERREKVDMKNQADSLAYQAERQIKDLGDKLPAADKNKIETLVKDLREAINQENWDRIKTLSNDLQQTLHTVNTNLYQQAGSSTSTQARNSSDGEVIDADFSESK